MIDFRMTTEGAETTVKALSHDAKFHLDHSVTCPVVRSSDRYEFVTYKEAAQALAELLIDEGWEVEAA